MIRRLRRLAQPPVGSVDFGDLSTGQPISRSFGYDRGTPVDRFYIEDFLGRWSGDIRGRVLEVADPTYSKRFGSGITHQDVLHVSDASATIVADITRPNSLPEQAFDCLIVTQTLQLTYEIEIAVRELHRGLKPGGVLLATMPGITSANALDWGGEWFWSITESTARRLFGDLFGNGNVEVATYGNVYSATCFLHGLAVEDVDRDRLSVHDPEYPVIVAIRAQRTA